MKKFLIPILLAALAFSPATYAKQPVKPIPSQTVPAAEPNEADLAEHGHYTNSDGQTVHSPAKSKTGKAPAGASAKCGDGSYSFSTHRRGTCSHHGGVSEWL